jgi:uncharacterized protein with von Willebrand factor type A (vWA) domain
MARVTSDGGVSLAVAQFADALRRVDVEVTVPQTLCFVEALSLTDGAGLRAIAHATLATSPEDIAAIDELLDGERGASPERADRPTILQVDDAGATAGDHCVGDDRARAGFSAVEVLRQRDIAACTDEERAQIRSLLRSVELVGDRRRSRRTRRERGSGTIDQRATLRSAGRTGGELVRLHHRSRRTRPRRVVLLLDVSGSMEPYVRSLLQLAHLGAAGPADVQVFALGTRLTRLTRHLSTRDPDAAFEAAVAAARDWGGGTRLGATLQAINDDPTTRGIVTSSTVIVASDGLDRGDPDQLQEQMARLARVAHRIIWVNPLRFIDGYEPTAAGMRAALPYVDAFVEGHSVAAFERLAELVATPPRRDR